MNGTVEEVRLALGEKTKAGGYRSFTNEAKSAGGRSRSNRCLRCVNLHLRPHRRPRCANVAFSHAPSMSVARVRRSNPDISTLEKPRHFYFGLTPEGRIRSTRRVRRSGVSLVGSV